MQDEPDDSVESTLTVHLSAPIEDKVAKQMISELQLQEPVLLQVDQFYREIEKTNPLTAMGLLISLVSNVPHAAIKTMKISDYKKCEQFLLHFLAQSRIAGAKRLQM